MLILVMWLEWPYVNTGDFVSALRRSGLMLILVMWSEWPYVNTGDVVGVALC